MPMAMRAKYQLDMNMTARHRQNPNTDRALQNQSVTYRMYASNLRVKYLMYTKINR
jgi:hypothetical protein